MVKQLTSFRIRFNRLFNNYLKEKEKELVEIEPSVKPLFVHLRKIASGGKRLRAFLCWLTYRGFGGKNKKTIFSLCIGVELFHLFALVHDDIMDKDDTRRGMSTIHAKFGVPTAILAGDLVLVLADEVVCQFSDSNSLLNYWNELKKEVMVGQFLDISGKDKAFIKTMELKTARYTLLRPMQLGASLAGAKKPAVEGLERYALPAGVAFQLRDDLLDKEKKEVSLVSLKGEQYCQRKIKTLLTDAKKALKNVTMKNKQKEILLKLSNYLVERKT